MRTRKPTKHLIFAAKDSLHYHPRSKVWSPRRWSLDTLEPQEASDSCPKFPNLPTWFTFTEWKLYFFLSYLEYHYNPLYKYKLLGNKSLHCILLNQTHYSIRRGVSQPPSKRATLTTSRYRCVSFSNTDMSGQLQQLFYTTILDVWVHHSPTIVAQLSNGNKTH